MDFCDKCGKILTTEKKDGVIKLICPKCGIIGDVDKEVKLSIEEDIRRDPIKELTIVVDQKSGVDGHSTKEMYCPKCKKNQMIAYWQVQTRSADESPTRFFSCKECEHTWREYD